MSGLPGGLHGPKRPRRAESADDVSTQRGLYGHPDAGHGRAYHDPPRAGGTSPDLLYHHQRVSGIRVCQAGASAERN